MSGIGDQGVMPEHVQPATPDDDTMEPEAVDNTVREKRAEEQGGRGDEDGAQPATGDRSDISGEDGAQPGTEDGWTDFSQRNP